MHQRGCVRAEGAPDYVGKKQTMVARIDMPDRFALQMTDSFWQDRHSARAVRDVNAFEGWFADTGVGYGDGYPSTVAGKAHVLINGERLPVIADVSANHFYVKGAEMETITLLMTFYLIVSLSISAVMNVYNKRVSLKER